MDLSVVVVHYKTPDLLVELVEGLRSRPPGTSFEIVVVDNGGGDSLAGLGLESSMLSVHPLGGNRGFAVAANEGLRKSRGEYALVANGDVAFPEGSVAQMLEAMRARPRAGALGVRLVRSDGSEEVNGGDFPTLLAEYHRRREILGKSRKRPGDQGISRGRAEERDWVSGACMLLNRDAAEEVGFFDERFFLYYEDVDLCTRLRQGGWKVYYDPSVEVIHHRGSSTRQVPDLARRAYRESQSYFWKKHHGLLGLGLLRAAVALKDLVVPALAGGLGSENETDLEG